jgi:hypothetical protein
MSSSDCDSKSSVDTKLKSGINNLSMTDADSDDDISGFDMAMAEMIDEFNSSTSHPTDYAGAVKKNQAKLDQSIPKKKKAETASPEEGTFEVLVNLNDPISHQLSDASFLAMQESTTNVMCDEIMSMFMKHCEDEYSMGVSDNPLNESVDSQLQLRATSYVIVQTIQKTSVNSLLHVLFDSGSNKTLLKQSALPPGITPSIGKKRKVIGVNASTIMDREVIIENMTLPEFLFTQCVFGPI